MVLGVGFGLAMMLYFDLLGFVFLWIDGIWFRVILWVGFRCGICALELCGLWVVLVFVYCGLFGGVVLMLAPWLWDCGGCVLCFWGV